MKIGIPRALLYYYYIPFWKTLFEQLNMEVIISEETNKAILSRGIKESVAEICVPIKIAVGHTISLLEKDVDFIFVPRMVSVEKGEYFCPKFMGLPDLIRHGVNGMEEKILSCTILSQSDDISDLTNYLPLLEPLKIEEERLKDALNIAREEWLAFRQYNQMGYTIDESLFILENRTVSKMNKKTRSDIKIALIGYVYNIYDQFVSMDLITKCKSLGVDVVTFEMISDEVIKKNITGMEKELFWTFSNKLLGAGYELFSNGEVDGVIHITAFGCGPDSFLSKLFELKSEETSIPFMMIRVDEHTGENHMQTRIEAFIDMLRRKKQVV